MTYERAGTLRRAEFQSATATPSEALQRGMETMEARTPGEGQTVIHYHFPVEIEVCAAPDPIDLEEVVQETLLRLARSLEST